MTTVPTGHKGVGRWLPAEHHHIETWLDKTIGHVQNNPTGYLPVINEFKEFIEGDATMYMLFSSMFTEVPYKPPYNKDPTGKRQVRDYKHMLDLFNYTIQNAPSWSDEANVAGMVGAPISAILDWPMATPSGYAAFIHPKVNEMFRKMFKVWSAYLESTASADALGAPNGWLSPRGLKALTSKGDDDQTHGPTFEELYICDPTKPNHGFESWDAFFTRHFRPGMRPICSPDDDRVIVNACESEPYCIAQNIKARDSFWIKTQPYSLQDILANDPIYQQYIGGTIYQAFLSALSYHRWHAPVSGTIVKTIQIPGTYYSEPPSEGFPGGDPDHIPPNNSQRYLTSVAARAAIFIKADNPSLGVVCVLHVGMADVSTCDIQVSVNQKVRKGQEIGMFHYGGSTHCLLFEKGVQLLWETYVIPSDADGPASHVNVPLGKSIAWVKAG